jgi:two-component system cell cycle response regulator DivK
VRQRPWARLNVHFGIGRSLSARILIIEDDGPSSVLVQYLLHCAGHRTISAADGREGVRLALQEGPDLVICDLQLPLLTGFEVVERLRAAPQWRCVPVIAVTASSMLGDRERVMRAGFDGYISKPIVPETFVADVEAFVAAGRAPGPRT